MKINNENWVKAHQAANLLVQDLRAAYATSEPLVEMIVLPLLEQAVQIEKKLKSLNRAITR